ncbi:MAG TPA: hypothetical protein VFO37_04835 [Chitinophagaceae bacterium]|nr:hypothetical protein [Chitinophagaceae bacterium]
MSQAGILSDNTGPGADVETLTPDVGAAVVPTAGNIDVKGAIGTLPLDSIVTHNIAASQLGIENRRWFSPYVVDPSAVVGARGTYTTVQAAITAASAAGGGVVFIRPGTYAENLTLAVSVDLVAITGGAESSGVEINGNHTFSGDGTAHYLNISFEATTGNNFTLSGAGAKNLYFRDCSFENTAANAIVFSSNPAGTANVYLSNCRTAAQVMADLTANTYLEIEGGIHILSGTADSFAINSGSSLYAQGAKIQGATLLSVDHATAVANAALCFLQASGAIVDFTAAGTARLHECRIETSVGGGNFATGTGTLIYADLVSTGTSIGIAGTITQTISDWKPYCTAGTSVTAIKGTAAFNEDDFTVSNGFVSLASLLVKGGPGITVDFAAGDYTVNSVVFTDQAGNTAVTADSGSFSTASVTLTTPAAPTQGDELYFIATTAGAGTLVVQLDGTQVAHLGNVATTAGGTITNTAIGDCIVLRYQTATDDWWATSSVGIWILA